MIVLTNVLVATDFSAASTAALAYGRALARTFDATLHVLHVADNLFLRAVPSDPRALVAAKTRTLHEQLTENDCDALRLHAGVEVSDDPADAIVGYARVNAIDVIVLGTHGRTAVQQLLVGSIAERVVRTARCPVVTVRVPGHASVVPIHQKSEAAMIALKKILVATDFSEPSEAALAYGRELSRTFGAQLLVAHVVDNIMTRACGGDGFVFTDPDLQRDIESSARRQIDRELSDADRELLRAEPVILTSIAPAVAIVDYAGRHNVDLIVMGTHGRGAVVHLLVGSVAERVVRSAPCPVLTVRHPEHEFVLPDTLVAVQRA